MCTRALQGIILSLSTFTHICFASTLVHGLLTDSYDSGEHSHWISYLVILLVICAILAVLSGNWKRVKNFKYYLTAEPEIHRLMPNGFRNAKLAQTLNIQGASILLDSASLSQYMYKHEDPPTSKKDEDTFKDISKLQGINSSMLADKFRYEETPMLLLIVTWIVI